MRINLVKNLARVKLISRRNRWRTTVELPKCESECQANDLAVPLYFGNSSSRVELCTVSDSTWKLKMEKETPAATSKTSTVEESGGRASSNSSASSSSTTRMTSKQPPSPQEKSLVKILEPSTDDEEDDDDELDLDESGE